MIKVSKVLVETTESWTEVAGKCFLHWCPGCEQIHIINTEKPNRLGVIWSFNGNLESPTFNPSINHKGCHYWINNGMINFCSDSNHNLSGKTVPMTEFPDDML